MSLPYSLLGDIILPNHVRLQHLKWDRDLCMVDVESESTVIKPGKV